MAISGWRDHAGGKCPLDPKNEVEVRFRNGKVYGPHPASHWRWASWPDGDSEWDIAAWKQADGK